MFYSHQLLARKAPLGQIWMAATMHAKLNRRKLDKLNIIKICEEILNPSIPMALRLSGILMGGVVIVYERKVKLLYDDVTRFLVEINEAWKVKTLPVPDPNMLPKGKSQAKKEAITLPENQEINVGEIEQSLNYSNTATGMAFQHSAYFTMRLDSVDVDEPYTGNGAREDEDPSGHLHQAAAENITLFERFESFQANEELYNRFERFDIEGDEETRLNATSGDYTQIPTTLIPSPPHQDDPKRDDIIQDQDQEHPVIQQNEEKEVKKEPRRRGPAKRKRGQPEANTMDYEHTIIPVHLYQHWLQNASDIVTRRGRKKKRTDIMASTKVADLMKIPPVVLICNLFTPENKDIYYPAPLIDLWVKSTEPPHDSPSERVSAHHPPEPSFSSPPARHNEDFVPFEDFDNRLDSQFLVPPIEKLRNNEQDTEILMDELRANLGHGLRVPETTPHVSSGKSGDSVHSFLGSVSEHGLSSHSGADKGRFTKKRRSSSGNSSVGLEPVAENANFKLARLSEVGDPTPDQELLVETGPTQKTQVNINHPNDKIADSIQAQMRAHFSTPGAPQVESLDILAAGMTRKSAALFFYQTCVLATRGALKVVQKEPYAEILISRGSKM